MRSRIWNFFVKKFPTEKIPGLGVLREMNSALRSPDHDEIHMTTPELIFHHGYRDETHHVWTEDGYRLEIHRVLPPIVETKSQEPDIETGSGTIYDTETKCSRPTIVIHHGLLSSSADWVLLGPKRALAYVLCDEGYDVWLANARGNRYSQCHTLFTTKDKEFWDFSWHEIGVYDLPAMIDYILKKTGNPNMSYIGYSQGTTALFVMASERPEYIGKIKGMVCMAPIAFLSNHRSPLLKCVVPLHMLMKWASMYCNINEWFPRNRLQAFALATLMRNAPDKFAQTFCYGWFHLVAGFGSDQLDKSMMPVVFGHFPAGASAKQILHYCQTIRSGLFRKFDYGEKINTKLYETPEPPLYDLSKVTFPVSLFYSDNDFLNHSSDVESLASALPNVVGKYKINYSKFNHIDYLWGRDAKELVYDDIVRVLRQF
ncbi:lipase 3-like [Diachasmimorpha longicaudata]|uniref:lipase 3-like n=1 Tax=Diachasmimorpha longicaudata TaxID=58733 RepID=UPI0030B90FF3